MYDMGGWTDPHICCHYWHSYSRLAVIATTTNQLEHSCSTVMHILCIWHKEPDLMNTIQARLLEASQITEKENPPKEVATCSTMHVWHMHWKSAITATVEPFYKNIPEMKTPPLIRALCMVPAEARIPPHIHAVEGTSKLTCWQTKSRITSISSTQIYQISDKKCRPFLRAKLTPYKLCIYSFHLQRSIILSYHLHNINFMCKYSVYGKYIMFCRLL